MPVLTCEHCKRDFKSRSTQRKNCSRRCSSAAKVKTFALPDGWHLDADGQWWRYFDGRRRRGVESACEHCGGRVLYEAGRPPRRFCSIGCSTRERCVPPGEVRNVGEGYVAEYLSPDDPLLATEMRRGNSFSILQHRLVMARHLGRPLSRHEQVHHVNGDRGDNRIENLQLRNGSHGSGRVARCADCGSNHVIFEEL